MGFQFHEYKIEIKYNEKKVERDIRLETLKYISEFRTEYLQTSKKVQDFLHGKNNILDLKDEKELLKLLTDLNSFASLVMSVPLSYEVIKDTLFHIIRRVRINKHCVDLVKTYNYNEIKELYNKINNLN